ncbi:MAG: cytochrome c [Phycisphaerales bacterium]
MTRRQSIVLTVVISVLGVLAVQAIVLVIVLYSGLYNVAASRPHAKVVRWFLGTMMDRSVERHARGVRPPGQASVEEGASHYSRMCVLCHGGPGVERSEIGQGLNPRPPDLMRSMTDWSPEQAYWIIKNGVKMTGMPAFGATRTEEQLWALAYFAKRLPQCSPAQYQDLLAKAGPSKQPGGSTQLESTEHQH